LDISMPDMDGYEVCRRLRQNPVTSHVLVMMLTAHDSLEEKIKGFEAGADDYLTKPFQPAELQARIKVLLRRIPQVVAPEPIIQKSKVISVYSLRGGIGVSTVATNLAISLAQIWSQPVVLVDLSLTMGQSALMMNLPLRNTWVDLARMPVKELELEQVQNVLLKHACGLSVLAAPRNVADGELVTAGHVTRVVEILKEKFSYVILDMPHDFRETSITGLDLSDDIVLLLAPELASVRAAGGAIEVFDTLGYNRTRIQAVLNWTFERRGLARKDIENVLHQSIQMVIPFMPDIFIPAINLGSPPVLSAPAGPVGALFEDFAYQLSKEEDRIRKIASPSEAWQRLTARQKSK
jgi:pilus assembly protein CpaE